MAIYVYWFILALVLFGMEMATGTFYLLVLSVAMAVAGLVALAGLAVALQLVFGAVTAVVGTILLRNWKGKQASDTAGQNLDIGQPVRLVSWGEQGKARVHYRGADWDAELEPADGARDGALYIKAMRGSVLVVAHDKPV